MRHRAERPLTSAWRRIPRALASRLGTLAELSPLPALLALVATLGIGTGAFAAVAHVGASLANQRTDSAAVGRPAATTTDSSGRSPRETGSTTSGRTPAFGPQNAPTRSSSTTSAPGPKRPSASASGSLRIHIPPSRAVGTPVPSLAGPASPAPSQPGSGTTGVTTPETSVSAQFPRGDAAVFTLAANEPASFVCSLDGAAYSPCTDPMHLTDLSPGPHTFAVRAIDQAGSTDPTAAVVNWHANRGPSVNH